MRKVLAVVLAAVLVGMFAYNADAQVPNISVYFDLNFTETSVECNRNGAFFDTAYVVANNFNSDVSAVEYRVTLPPSMSWQADDHDAPLQAGVSSPTGLALSYQTPQNAFISWKIERLRFVWQCLDCVDLGHTDYVVVGGYLAAANPPKYSQWLTNFEFEAVGMTSTVCPEFDAIAAEEESWGSVKSKYAE